MMDGGGIVERKPPVSPQWRGSLMERQGLTNECKKKTSTQLGNGGRENYCWGVKQNKSGNKQWVTSVRFTRDGGDIRRSGCG